MITVLLLTFAGYYQSKLYILSAFIKFSHIFFHTTKQQDIHAVVSESVLLTSIDAGFSYHAILFRKVLMMIEI